MSRASSSRRSAAFPPAPARAAGTSLTLAIVRPWSFPRSPTTPSSRTSSRPPSPWWSISGHPWCGPCRVVNPIIEDLASQHGERVKFLKLNVDDNPGTSARYNVLSIPTVILFEGGEPQEAVIGARSKGHYESAWERWLVAAA